MSLFLMWETSCARTPLSSSLFNSFKMPWVIATAACFPPLPVAKALLILEGTMKSCGLMIFACLQMFSISSWNSGYSCLDAGWAL